MLSNAFLGFFCLKTQRKPRSRPPRCPSTPLGQPSPLPRSPPPPCGRAWPQEAALRWSVIRHKWSRRFEKNTKTTVNNVTSSYTLPTPTSLNPPKITRSYKASSFYPGKAYKPPQPYLFPPSYRPSITRLRHLLRLALGALAPLRQRLLGLLGAALGRQELRVALAAELLGGGA